MWLTYLEIVECHDTFTINLFLFDKEEQAQKYIEQQPYSDLEKIGIDLDVYSAAFVSWSKCFVTLIKSIYEN